MFGSQISLITAMSFREAVPLPPNHPPGVLPLDPAGGLPFPRPPVPLPPNLGYATASVCLSQGAAALGHRHAGCLRLSHHRQPPEMCGLRTRPRPDVVDPPRVELPSAGVGVGAYRLAVPGATTRYEFVIGRRQAGVGAAWQSSGAERGGGRDERRGAAGAWPARRVVLGARQHDRVRPTAAHRRRQDADRGRRRFSRTFCMHCQT